MTKTPASRWHKARMTFDGPPFVKMGHLVRYRPEDVERWLMGQRYISTDTKLSPEWVLAGEEAR